WTRSSHRTLSSHGAPTCTMERPPKSGQQHRIRSARVRGPSRGPVLSKPGCLYGFTEPNESGGARVEKAWYLPGINAGVEGACICTMAHHRRNFSRYRFIDLALGARDGVDELRMAAVTS